MKNGIHPDYHPVTVQLVNGTQYETRSTFGKKGDLLRLDVDPSVHPAWTGSTKLIVQTGSVAKFNKRFSKFGVGSTTS